MMLKKGRSFSVVILIVLAVVAVWLIGKTPGCTATPAGFRSEVSSTEPADLFAGAWEGTWNSKSKPLSGRLTAIIEKTPDGNYHASFVSQNPFGSDDKSVCVFHISDRSPPPTVWQFHGKENLGFLKGGTYTYTGTVDAEKFICTYDSTFDQGTFQMQRKSQK
ncbi:MAG: hypothetical protein FWD61_02315 [Phycisphaerales bacterium]|nr:hypothetical protein [Phycisphaerales bacterium]